MPDSTPRTAARAAGAGYLALFVLGFLANILAVGSVHHEDPRTTFADLAASETTFRVGIAAFLAILVLDVVIAWGLLVLLSDYARYADAFLVVVAVSAVVAEAWLGIWLLLVGLARRPIPANDPIYPVVAGAERP